MDIHEAHDEIQEMALGVKKKGQPGYHPVKRATKSGKMRTAWIHVDSLTPDEVDQHLKYLPGVRPEHRDAHDRLEGRLARADDDGVSQEGQREMRSKMSDLRHQMAWNAAGGAGDHPLKRYT